MASDHRAPQQRVTALSSRLKDSMENLAKEIKLIAIDIDGTLLTPTGQITPRVRAAIRAAQQAGVIVTLATSRRYMGTKAVAEALGLALPLIIYDGGLVVHHPSRAIMYSRPMVPEVSARVIEIFQRQGVQPVAQPCENDQCVLEEVWTGPASYDQPELATYLSIAPERVRRLSFAQLCSGEQAFLRVVAFASEAAVQRLIPEISQLPCSWHTLAGGGYNSAELAVMHATTSKASGVAALAAHFQISLAEVMALGDNNNDIAMLREVGLGVAMGQASPAVQAAADVVTASNLQDGVALAIERYVLAAHPASLPLLFEESTDGTDLLSFNLWAQAKDETSRANV